MAAGCRSRATISTMASVSCCAQPAGQTIFLTKLSGVPRLLEENTPFSHSALDVFQTEMCMGLYVTCLAQRRQVAFCLAESISKYAQTGEWLFSQPWLRGLTLMHGDWIACMPTRKLYADVGQHECWGWCQRRCMKMKLQSNLRIQKDLIESVKDSRRFWIQWIRFILIPYIGCELQILASTKYCNLLSYCWW